MAEVPKVSKKALRPAPLYDPPSVWRLTPDKQGLSSALTLRCDSRTKRSL
ncbi:hypothetical protein [Dysgonomonas sp. 521]|nr:hypothetical protein [Dysgonomonas sp. 521]